MIQVTIGESKAQVKHFPKLMKSTINSLQVFFTEPGIGIVVVAGNDYGISHYSSDWAMCSFTDIEEAAPVVVKPFPKSMIATDPSDNADGTIVYFTKPESGVIIYTPSNYKYVGYKSDTFIMKYFTDFNGSITLQNS
jgi:hypothetical protein